VSVALCARDAAGTVLEAARSVLDQSWRRLELFVVDDGSADDTSRRVREGIEDARATLIRLEKNVGTYAAKNLLLDRFARGEFFAHQDADDRSLPRRLERQIGFLRARRLAACGTGVDEFWSDPALEPRFSKELPARLDPRDGCFHKHNLYPERLDARGLCDPATRVEDLKLAMNGSLLFRSETLRELGGFDGRTPVGADTDLLLRLACLQPVGNVPEVLYARRFHRASLTAAPETGFGSEARRRAILGIEALRAELRRLLEAGELEGARRAAARDLYYPEVSCEVWPLGPGR
jgi:glycosyltransferase involved in cell wall biosynthesis